MSWLNTPDFPALSATVIKCESSTEKFPLRTLHEFANPALAPSFQHFQQVLCVYARGDELRAIVHHRGENAFSFQIHECHTAYVHHAFAYSARAMGSLPVRSEETDPWPGQPALQRPPLLRGLFEDCCSQHRSLHSHSGSARAMPISNSETKSRKGKADYGIEEKRNFAGGPLQAVRKPAKWQSARLMAPRNLTIESRNEFQVRWEITRGNHETGWAFSRESPSLRMRN